MKSDHSDGKWWLAAILLPILSIGIGYLAALSTPLDQDDWLGLRRIFPIYLGLFVGCVLCCIATIISIWRVESLCAVPVIFAIPSLIFIIYTCTLIVQARYAAQHQKAIQAVRYKEEKQQMDQINLWRDKFRTNLTLITDDNLWNSQTNQESYAQRGLDELIRDQSFKFSPQINEYVSKRFPSKIQSLLLYKKFTRDELMAMAKNPQYPKPIQESALRQLVLDKNFEVTDEWKKYVIEQFPDELGDLLLDEKFTKSELEALLQNSRISDEEKKIIKDDLEAERYKN